MKFVYYNEQLSEYHHSPFTGFILHPVFVTDFDFHILDFIVKSQFDEVF